MTKQIFNISALETFRFRWENYKSMVANSVLTERQKMYELLPSYLLDLQKLHKNIDRSEEPKYIKTEQEIRKFINTYLKND